MFLPDKLLEKALYWGPLFVGVVSLVAGAVLIQVSYDTPSSLNKQIAQHSLKPHDDASRNQRSAELPAPVEQSNIENKVPDKPEANVTELQAEMVRKRPEMNKDAQRALKQEQRMARARAERALAEKELALAEKRALEEKRGIEEKSSLAAKRDMASKKALAEKAAALELSNKLAALEKSAEAAGAFAGDFGASSLVSAMAVTDYSALSFKKHAQTRQAEELSELAGKLSVRTYDGIRLLDGNPLRILVDYHGDEFGRAGKNFAAGLNYFSGRQSIPLIAHGSELIGGPASLAFAGSRIGDNSGQVIAANYLQEWSGEVGSASLFILTGLANSADSASALKRQYEIYQIGGKLAAPAVTASFKGLSRAIENSETLVVAAAVHTALPGVVGDGGALDKKGSCADRFYAALSNIYTSKIAFLGSSTKPISVMDNDLPGKWYFGSGRNSGGKALRKCARWKTYYSGRRKCLKWERTPKSETIRSYPTDKNEKEFYALANNLVSGKGRHSFVKPRSPSHWVINRIATDLKTYSKQEPHPAICTGALGMMSYFDGNLGKVRTHISEVAEMALRSEQIVRVKGFRLNEALDRFQRARDAEQPEAVSSEEGDETVSSISGEDESNQISISNDNKANGGLSVKVTVNDLSKTLYDFTDALYGSQASGEISTLDDDLSRLKFIRPLYVKYRAQYDDETNKAAYEFLHAVEASLYIRRTDRIYQKLSENLFGSIKAIRAAHKSQCKCSY